MHVLVGVIALLPPLIAGALRGEWGIVVGFADWADLTQDDRDLLADDLVAELERTGKDMAWRTSRI